MKYGGKAWDAEHLIDWTMSFLHGFKAAGVDCDKGSKISREEPRVPHWCPPCQASVKINVDASINKNRGV